MQEEALNGVLLVDKPAGISSFGVISQIRRILGIKRVGHCGTLDNFATGVLVVMLGKATRLARFVSVQDKCYKAKIVFGQKTDTADITGEVIGTSGLPSELDANLRTKVLDITSQVPPIYSAIKVDGKRAYALARKGDVPQMKPRAMEVLDFEVDSFDCESLCYTAKVSKGTYIRTLSEDISELLGVVGTTESLCRQECAGFRLEECVRVEPNMDRDFLLSKVLSPDVLLKDLPAIELDESKYSKFICGNSFGEERGKNGFTKIYHCGVLVGVAWVEQGEIRPKIVF